MTEPMQYIRVVIKDRTNAYNNAHDETEAVIDHDEAYNLIMDTLDKAELKDVTVIEWGYSLLLDASGMNTPLISISACKLTSTVGMLALDDHALLTQEFWEGLKEGVFSRFTFFSAVSHFTNMRDNIAQFVDIDLDDIE